MNPADDLVEDAPPPAFSAEPAPEPAPAPVQQPVGTPLEAGPQGLKERVLGVLFLPEWAFAHHRAAWGWLWPWLLVALLGVAVGAITLASVDLGAVLQAQAEAGFDQLPSAQREQMEAPATKEMIEKGIRMQAFFMKVWMIAGPFLGGLMGILLVGGLLFGASRFFGSKDTPLDLMRCVSLAAWLSLVNGLQYIASACGVLTGNPIPITSPAGLVNAAGHPVIHTALSRLDPLVLLYYGLLSVALTRSLRFEPKRARRVTFGIYAGLSLMLLALAGLSVLGQKLGQGAGS